MGCAGPDWPVSSAILTHGSAQSDHVHRDASDLTVRIGDSADGRSCYQRGPGHAPQEPVGEYSDGLLASGSPFAPSTAARNPRRQQRRQQEFGCNNIALTAEAGGKLTGEMQCADKVGRRLAVTGTIALMK